MAISSLAAELDPAADAPVLVLGNSMGTTAAVWEPQLAQFRRHFRLLRYEYPGHGGSAAPAGPYTVGELGAAVLGLLDEHGIGRARYCGISLGGMVGMWLAANAPDRIDALAVCCTSAYLPPAPFWAGRAQQARAEGTGPIAEQVVSRWFTPEFAAREPDVPASFVAGLAQVAAEGYAGCCEAIGAMDLRPSLPAITAPTLVIAGAEDPATPPWHGAVIASAIPGARLAVVRGAAHLASVSAPGQVGCGVLGFLLG
ncbi:MAG: 3-oxoadipate enol-lactonase [Streptosporangiaceae bacterium]